MTIGLGALARPLGPLAPCAVSAGGRAESGSGSPITSARRLESGDHSYPCRRPFTSVSWNASPPLRSRSHTCEPRALPGRDDVNERYLPSGLQRGDDSLSCPHVIWRSLLPSKLAIQMCAAVLSSRTSMLETT